MVGSVSLPFAVFFATARGVGLHMSCKRAFRERSHAASVVLVGRDRAGNWVVREQDGVFGGLFLDRRAAFKYALLENGYHTQSIIEVPHELEFDGPVESQIVATKAPP